jgi:hypothetical protein
MLADMVRTDSHQLRAVAADSPGAEAVKVVARAHKTLIWERMLGGWMLQDAVEDAGPVEPGRYREPPRHGHQALTWRIRRAQGRSGSG